MSRLFLFLLLLPGCDSAHKFITGSGPKHLGDNAIIVAMGQSNIVGRGENTEYPNNPNVVLTRDIRTGPAYYAASLFTENYSNVILLQCGEGSTTIDRWVPSGDRYQRCVTEAKALAQQTGYPIVGLLFYQGESDARETLDPQWPEKFEDAIETFRMDVGVPKLPVVWARLGQLGPKLPSDYYENWATFKQNQLRVQLDNDFMIETDDQPVVDDVHHGYEVNKVIGLRFYLALLSLIGRR